MGGLLELILPIAALLFPFVAAPLLWRRMKHVRDGAYRDTKTQRRQEPWQEKIASEGGLNLVRSDKANDDLIDLGSKARETRWPIDNA